MADITTLNTTCDPATWIVVTSHDNKTMICGSQQNSDQINSCDGCSWRHISISSKTPCCTKRKLLEVSHTITSLQREGIADILWRHFKSELSDEETYVLFLEAVGED